MKCMIEFWVKLQDNMTELVKKLTQAYEDQIELLVA